MVWYGVFATNVLRDKDCKNRRKLVVMPENGSCYNPFHSVDESNKRNKW